MPKDQQKSVEEFMAKLAFRVAGVDDVLLACPCCGNINLYVGPMSCDSVGVHCRSGEDMVDRILVSRGDLDPNDMCLKGCGLQLAVLIPDEYPVDFPEKLSGMKAVEYLRQLTLVEAVRRWNQRT